MSSNPRPTTRGRRRRLHARHVPSTAVTALAALALTAITFPAPADAASAIPGWTQVPVGGVLASFANGQLLTAGPTVDGCAALRVLAPKSWKAQEVGTACGTVDGTSIVRTSATGHVVYRAAGSDALTLWTPRGRRLTVDVTGLAAPVRVQAVTLGGQVALRGDGATSVAIWTPGVRGLRSLPAGDTGTVTEVTDAGQVVTLAPGGRISRAWQDRAAETATLPDSGYTGMRANSRGDVVAWGDLTVRQPLRVWTAATGTWRTVPAPEPWNCSNTETSEYISGCSVTVAGFNSRQEILVGVATSYTDLPGDMGRVRPMGFSDSSQEWHLISPDGVEVSSGLGSPRSFTDDGSFIAAYDTYSGSNLTLVQHGQRWADFVQLDAAYTWASLQGDGTLIGPRAWIKNKVSRMPVSPSGPVTTWTDGVETVAKTATVGGTRGSMVEIPLFGPDISASRRIITAHLRLHTTSAAGSGSLTTMQVRTVTNQGAAAPPTLGPVVGTIAPTGPDSDVLVVLDPALLPAGQPAGLVLVSPGGDDALTVTTADLRLLTTVG